MSYYTVKNDMLQTASKLSPNAFYLEKREGWHRYDSAKKTIVDARVYSDFFIDSAGIKHIEQPNKTWQKLVCSFNDELIKQGETWHVKTEQDTLNEVKQELRQLINEKKAQSFESGLVFEGDTYQTDKDSQARIQGTHTYALSLSETEKPKHKQMWITADNKPVNLSYSQVLGLGKAVKEHVEKHIALAATYKQKLMSATTAAAAQAVFDEYTQKLST